MKIIVLIDQNNKPTPLFSALTGNCFLFFSCMEDIELPLYYQSIATLLPLPETVTITTITSITSFCYPVTWQCV